MTNHDHAAGRHVDGAQNCPIDPVVRHGRWILIAFAAIAAFFLLAEHRAHVLGFLPFAFLLACPLLHVFMHGGHGGHGGHTESSDAPRTKPDTKPDGREWK